MKAPEPIRLPDKTRALLDDAGRIRAWSSRERERAWKGLLERAKRPSRRWRRGALALAACTLLIVALRPRHLPPEPRTPAPATETRINVGDRGELTLSSSSSSRVLSVSPSQLAIELHAGRASLQVPLPERRPAIRVQTPAVLVRGFARRFAVSVEGGTTTVEVFEGELRLEKGAAVLVVRAGEMGSSDDSRLTPAAPPPASAPAKPTPSKPIDRQAAFDACGDATGRTAYLCYGRLASGSDLIAGNALYAQVLLARDVLRQPDAALAHLREYEARFSSGPLLPEAMLATLELLTDGGRSEEAAVEGRLFLQRFPNHPAAAHVREGLKGVRNP